MLRQKIFIPTSDFSNTKGNNEKNERLSLIWVSLKTKYSFLFYLFYHQHFRIDHFASVSTLHYFCGCCKFRGIRINFSPLIILDCCYFNDDAEVLKYALLCDKHHQSSAAGRSMIKAKLEDSSLRI